MGVLKVPIMRFLASLVLCLLLANPAWSKTRFYNFYVKEAPYTRLCHTKNILTVNGQLPGPTLYAQSGDTLIVRVYNQADQNVTIHWHGVDQPRNPWSDGPEYITQCPIQPGADFTYTVKLTWEEGTVWWHAHNAFARNTVHGAIIVRPRHATAFPFPKPYKEIPIILGEWWNAGTTQLLDNFVRSGGDMNVSDAYTINGQPGDLYPCSKQGTFTATVEHGKTYLLRVVNANMNAEIFFAVAGHKLTVVGSDGSYNKPYTVDHVFIIPGQTLDLLLKADQPASRRYYMAARGYMANPTIPLDNGTATALLRYLPATHRPNQTLPPAELPYLPEANDTAAATSFTLGRRSLADERHPVDVPRAVDERLLITASTSVLACAPSEGCNALPIPRARIVATLNNISFVTPTLAPVLEAYYRKIPGVYGMGFPSRPPVFFNFTGDGLPASLMFAERATEVKVFEFNRSVEIVFQGTNLLNGADNHPMHLHGYSFYTVGMGFGNWDEKRDPQRYNLVDPPLQNTVGVPVNGWVAIRFRTTNPGVWFMHCHIERHAIWGMNTVFIVKDGPSRRKRLLRPPPNMPPC